MDLATVNIILTMLKSPTYFTTAVIQTRFYMDEKLIKPLSIAGTTYPVNLIQGPLAGISCSPFRRLSWLYSQPAFNHTEMLSSNALISKPLAFQKRFVHIAPDEGPVCFQLSSNNPNELGEATKIATQAGANLIDLNCGCPVKKIRSKGAGSRLLTDQSTLYKLMTAMKNNTHLPVSIKIRVEGNSSEKFHEEIVKIVTDAGIDLINIHGRHWTDDYSVACHYDDIRFFVERLKIPVIGNGDIACLNSLKKMLATGCAGAMISRAGVGQPWLIKKLIQEANGNGMIDPTPKERSIALLEHVKGLIELLDNEKFAILQTRKFAKYYARNLPIKSDFHLAMTSCHTLQNFQSIVEEFFN